MNSLEAVQLLPPARTFWNCNDPTLDPFDETLMPSMASPLEAACSSTFLFPPPTGSTCDSGDSQVFKSTIFDEISVPAVAEEDDDEEEEEGAESSKALLTPNQLYPSTSTWNLPAHNHRYPPLQGGQAPVPHNHYSGSQLCPDESFGPMNGSAPSTALDSGHGAKNHTLGPLMRQPRFRPPANAGLLKQQQQQLKAAKTSWKSATMFELPRRSRGLSHKEPLGSPCSVISGFTKVVDQFVSMDYAIEISGSSRSRSRSFGPSTSAALDEASLKYSQERNTPERGGAHSLSGAQEVVVKPLTTKRKRSKLPKLSNEVESQRMTHIAVERNRRKQMNEHLAALRALMPGSYVQKGDQASIVGGAIEFVKELEHLLHCLQSRKRRRVYSELSTAGTPTSRLATPNPEPHYSQLQPSFIFHSPQRLVDPSPFLLPGDSSTGGIHLFPGKVANTRPQLSGSYPGTAQIISVVPASSSSSPLQPRSFGNTGALVGEARSDMASVEVKLVTVPGSIAGSGSVSVSSDLADTAALVKIMATRRAGQLLRTVVALESLALTVMHTNITTVGHTVLYSFNVQIGALCCMNVDEIARAIHKTFASLHALQF